MTAWGSVIDLATLSLRDDGPQTRLQLQTRLGINKQCAGQMVTRMTRPMTRGPFAGTRRAHIARWEYQSDGEGRDYLRAVYAYGDGKDAKRPPPRCSKQVKREYWARRKQRLEQFGPGADLQAVWNARAQ